VVWDYIALDNPDAADRFLEAAYRCFRELERTPEMGRPRMFAAPRLSGMRSFRVKDFENYLVFYRTVPEGIEVFRVLHGARDLDTVLGEE
jgi:toxin ParE1/3/4